MTKSESILEEIRDDKIHGASYLVEKALGATSQFLKEIQPRKKEQYILFRAFTIKLLSTRREFAPLIRLANDLNNLWDNALSADSMLQKIKNLKEEWELANKNAVDHAVKVLKNCSKILVHSHSGTVTRTLLEIKPSTVICTESYPGFEGYEQAKSILDHGIKTQMVVDTAVSAVTHEIDCVLLGCDAITTEGAFNKIGTTPLALIAREFGKPVYVVSTSHRFLPKSLYAFFYHGESSEVPKKQIKVEKFITPLLELIPWKLVTSVIIESGNYSPAEITNKIGDVKVHPVISAVLPEIMHHT